MNILQVKKYRLLIKDKQQNKLSLYILFLEKLLKNKEKQLKSKEKKQIKSLEKHGKQLVQSNELIKKDFNIDKDGILLGKQKHIEEKSFEFQTQKKDLNNLIYWHKTKGISRNGSSNYHNLIDLLNELRDGNINPEEVLKDQSNFKSYLQSWPKYFRQTVAFL